MISPDYLEQCPDRLTEIYEQAERDIIADMARKLNKYDYFSSASEWQAKKLQEMGLTYKEIQTRLAKASGKTKSEIVKLLKEAGTKELSDDGVEPTQATIDVLNAGLDKTLGKFDNLTKTTAICGSRQISETLDRVYMQVTSGAFSQEAAIKNAITELAKKGIEAYDYGTRKDYIDVVVRRAVRTGVNQTVAKIALSNAEQLGTDLVEVSAHSGARPTHAEWQGKVFSISGKTKGYEKLSEATGYGTVTGLCGANCRHTFYPFMEGDEPAYTEEELQSYDELKYTYNGHKMTEYVATQRQRYIERQIRRYKREKAGMQAAELPTEESQAKIKKWEEIQADFLSQTGLKRQYGREEIPEPQKMSDEERKAINDYISSASYTVNEALRKKLPLTADQKELKINLDSALKKLPKYKGNVSRSLYFTNEESIESFMKMHQENSKVTYSEFISTTYGETYNTEGQVQISIRNSRKGRNLSGFNKKEKEILYERGSTFFVEKVLRVGNQWHILMVETNE
jgi:ribosomal protein L44E